MDENEIVAGTIEATDEDIDDEIEEWNLVTGGDSDLFDTSDTGELTFKAAPDFEIPDDADRDHVYELRYTVGSGVGDRLMSSGQRGLTVTVTDANDSPVFSSGATHSVAENTVDVVALMASDQDVGDTVTFSIDATDAATGGEHRDLFEIASGVLRFEPAPDFENGAGAGSDSNTYTVIVTASDSTVSVTQTITITVTDANDPPVFSSGATPSVEENTVDVVTLEASDQDAGDTVSFSIDAMDATTGGQHRDLFEIASGVLRFKAAPDFENGAGSGSDSNIYEVIVTASDGTASVTPPVTVTVTGVNEAPSTPALANQQTRQGEAFTYTFDPSADPEGHPVSYTAAMQDGIVLPVWLTFDAGARTFSVTTSDPSLPGDYDMTVTASDDQSTPLTSQAFFRLTVIAVGAPQRPGGRGPSDRRPAFGSQTVTDQTYVAGEDVGTVSLPAASGGDGSLRYTLAPALPAGMSFDSEARTITGTPRAAFPRTRFTYTATDADGDSVSLRFYITVTNLDEGAEILGDMDGEVTEAGGKDNADGGTPTASGSLRVMDPEAGQTFDFVPREGDNAVQGTYGTFTITAAGFWTYTLDNDRAATEALDAGDTVTVEFTAAADPVTPTEGVVTIIVNGANDVSVIAGDTTGAVTEDAAGDTADGTLAVSDPDAGDSPTIVAVATATPADNGYGSFTVTAGGVWTYTLDNDAAATNALDANETVTDTFTVGASDGNTQVVTITVTGANDAPTADAWENREVAEGETVTLDGSGSSDPEGQTLSYNLDSDRRDHGCPDWREHRDAELHRAGGPGNVRVQLDGERRCTGLGSGHGNLHGVQGSGRPCRLHQGGRSLGHRRGGRHIHHRGKPCAEHAPGHHYRSLRRRVLWSPERQSDGDHPRRRELHDAFPEHCQRQPGRTRREYHRHVTGGERVHCQHQFVQRLGRRQRQRPATALQWRRGRRDRLDPDLRLADGDRPDLHGGQGRENGAAARRLRWRRLTALHPGASPARGDELRQRRPHYHRHAQGGVPPDGVHLHRNRCRRRPRVSAFLHHRHRHQRGRGRRVPGHLHPGARADRVSGPSGHTHSSGYGGFALADAHRNTLTAHTGGRRRHWHMGLGGYRRGARPRGRWRRHHRRAA